MKTAPDISATEAAIIGSLLEADGTQLRPNLAKLVQHAPESFDDQRHGAIAVAIRALIRAGQPVNSVTVHDQLEKARQLETVGGITYLMLLGQAALPLALAEAEAGQLWQCYQTRRGKSLLGEALAELDKQPDMAGPILSIVQRGLADLAGEQGKRNGTPPIMDAAGFLAEKITLPRELVSGILHQGSKMVLGGGSKTFKTWTLLDLAVAVATGEPWLSFKTTKGRVLFLNFEIQPGFFQQRLHAVAQAKGVELNKGQIDLLNLRGHACGYNLLLPRISEQVKAAGYALIILDPIYKLYGETDENSAGAVALLLNAVESLTVDTGAAVAFGAHYSKGNQAGKEAIDRISGSGVFARDPDSILNFTRHEEQDAFTVEATLRNFRPIEPFVVRWQYPLMRRDGSLDPAKLKQLGGRPKLYTVDKLVSVLKGQKLESQNWLKIASTKTGIGKSRFYAVLEEAKKDPKLKQTPEGQWFYDDAPIS